MRLRTKFALVLLAVTVILSGGAYGGVELYKSQQIQQTQADVEESAELVAAQVEVRLRDHRDYVAYIAQQPRTADFSNSKEVLTGLLGNSRFFAAQLVAANGTVVDVRGPYSTDRRQEIMGSDASEGPCISETLSTGDICTTDPVGVGNDSWALVITAPIFEDNEIHGVLAAGIRINRQTLFPMVGPLQSESQTVAISHEGTTLHRPGQTFDRAITGGATVDSTGWQVTVARDRSGLSERLRWLAFAQGIGLLLVFCTMVGLGYWEYRVNLTQTDRLLEGFRALERGDYDHSPDLRAAEEWEQIQDAFVDLADGLATREAELRQREQRLSVLNRVIRHNLRNDMNVIIGYAELLQNSLSGEHDRFANMAERIRQTSEKLVAVGERAREAESVLGQDIAPQPIDLVPLVVDAIDEVSEEHAVEPSRSLPTQAWARAHSSIDRAIVNVLTNACQYADPENPEVEVRIAIDDRVRIEVEDNGPGIPEHERNAIKKGRETSLEHGSGLGLWVTKWIVETVGGELSFEVDEGTVVVLAFDHAERPDTSAEEGSERR